MSEDLKKSADLLRHQLGSIDMSDIDQLKEITLKPVEAMSRSGSVETFYKTHFEKVLKLLINKQLEFIGTEATDDLKLQFGRGTFNGLLIIRDWMEKETQKSLSRFDKPPAKTADTGLEDLD